MSINLKDHGADYPSVIALHTLRVKVRLGVGEKERAVPQDVVIDVRLYLPHLPAAAESDDAEYLCYHSLSEKIHALCVAKEYRLIEYLTHAIHRLLRASVPSEAKLWIKLRKPHILLDYVQEGASYIFTDLSPESRVVPQ
jgi:FolB domain-containing protein